MLTQRGGRGQSCGDPEADPQSWQGMLGWSQKVLREPEASSELWPRSGLPSQNLGWVCQWRGQM